MKAQKIAELLNARIVNLNAQSEITTGYCGDFLSFVMGRAPSGCCWFTVMNNINVAGVAALADIGLVVLCEGTKCDEALRAKSLLTGINIIETDYDIFSAVLKVFK
ncbi:MAG: hypothetical protein EOM87_00170 [Clostridia bacterium]|nr:hypothetical protein [Clostridia bacterium]